VGAPPGRDAAGTGLTIVIRLEPGEPLRGTVSVADDGAPPRRFSGWVELMAQITRARRDHGKPPRR
jgi:hypothetical protein